MRAESCNRGAERFHCTTTMPTVFVVDGVPADKWQWIDQLVAEGVTVAVVSGVSGIQLLVGKGIDAVVVDTSDADAIVAELVEALPELERAPAIVLIAGDAGDLLAFARRAGLPATACPSGELGRELGRSRVVPRKIDDVATAPMGR